MTAPAASRRPRRPQRRPSAGPRPVRTLGTVICPARRSALSFEFEFGRSARPPSMSPSPSLTRASLWRRSLNLPTRPIPTAHSLNFLSCGSFPLSPTRSALRLPPVAVATTAAAGPLPCRSSFALLASPLVLAMTRLLPRPISLADRRTHPQRRDLSCAQGAECGMHASSEVWSWR